MTDLLFATPWWLLASLIIVGGALFWSGNNSQQSSVRNAGIGLIVFAILLKAVSFFVETDKEKVSRQTVELVAAVQNKDWVKFNLLLDSDVSLNTQGGTLFSDRNALLEGAKHDSDTYQLTAITGHVTNVVQDKTGITVDLDASSEQSVSLGMRVPSSWRLVWDRTGDQWRVHEITCLKIANETSVNAINQYIGK